MADVIGVRENQLMGYGIVIGLSGSGDTGKAYVTVESVLRMLEHLKVSVNQKSLSAANCAAVMVTGKLPPSIRPGEQIDVTVASLGNARSLAGGILIMAPLKGLDGEIYAVAQGSVSVGGFALGSGSRDRLQKNIPTVGTIPGGAIIEKGVQAAFLEENRFSLGLPRTDFEAVSRIVDSINGKYGEGTAASPDGSRIDVQVPAIFQKNTIAFMADIEAMEITLTDPERVVVNERTGTVVVGGALALAPVTVTHGSLHVAVMSRDNVSQPNAFASGSTMVTEQLELRAQEDGGGTYTSGPGSVTVDTLVRSLNQLGASPRDIVSILQDIYTLGAIPGKLEVR